MAFITCSFFSVLKINKSKPWPASKEKEKTNRYNILYGALNMLNPGIYVIKR